MPSCTDTSALQLRTPSVQHNGLLLILRSCAYLGITLLLKGCSSSSHSLFLLRFFLLITSEDFVEALVRKLKGSSGSHQHQCCTWQHPDHKFSCRKEITKYEISQSTKKQANINYKTLYVITKSVYEAFWNPLLCSCLNIKKLKIFYSLFLSTALPHSTFL